jgi:hypothetical protein
VPLWPHNGTLGRIRRSSPPQSAPLRMFYVTKIDSLLDTMSTPVARTLPLRYCDILGKRGRKEGTQRYRSQQDSTRQAFCRSKVKACRRAAFVCYTRRYRDSEVQLALVQCPSGLENQRGCLPQRCIPFLNSALGQEPGLFLDCSSLKRAREDSATTIRLQVVFRLFTGRNSSVSLEDPVNPLLVPAELALSYPVSIGVAVVEAAEIDWFLASEALYLHWLLYIH